MCMIITKPKNVNLPKEEYLKTSYNYNKDGIGIMYLKKNSNTVRIKKDFKTYEEFLSFIKRNITKEDILVIHFRYATSGKVDKGNSHPFPIVRNRKLLRQLKVNCKYAVVHNGVISKYSGHSKFSDTQKFIMDILADNSIKYNLHKKEIQKLITHYINNDRLVILNGEGNLIFIGEHEKADDSCYYSNSGYRSYFTEEEENTIYIYKDFSFDGKCNICNKYHIQLIEAEYQHSFLCVCPECLKKLTSEHFEAQKEECNYCNKLEYPDNLYALNKDFQVCDKCSDKILEDEKSYKSFAKLKNE